MLGWDLEDWITDVGARLLEKQAIDPRSLTPTETLVVEIWLLDTEARNGGLSQYFFNNGLSQWQTCVAAAHCLNTFRPFVEAVKEMIHGADDPFEAIRSRGNDGEDLWYKYQAPVIVELRQMYGDAI
jgi:hypothetical protein